MAAVVLRPGTVSVVTTGGTPVTVIPANANGGIITNPMSKTDQAIDNAEPLYIDPINPAGVVGTGTTFALQPGQSWNVVPGQTTATSVNAATGGHQFSVIYW